MVGRLWDPTTQRVPSTPSDSETDEEESDYGSTDTHEVGAPGCGPVYDEEGVPWDRIDERGVRWRNGIGYPSLVEIREAHRQSRENRLNPERSPSDSEADEVLFRPPSSGRQISPERDIGQGVGPVEREATNGSDDIDPDLDEADDAEVSHNDPDTQYATKKEIVTTYTIKYTLYTDAADDDVRPGQSSRKRRPGQGSRGSQPIPPPENGPLMIHLRNRMMSFRQFREKVILAIDRSEEFVGEHIKKHLTGPGGVDWEVWIERTAGWTRTHHRKVNTVNEWREFVRKKHDNIERQCTLTIAQANPKRKGKADVQRELACKELAAVHGPEAMRDRLTQDAMRVQLNPHANVDPCADIVSQLMSRWANTSSRYGIEGAVYVDPNDETRYLVLNYARACKWAQCIRDGLNGATIEVPPNTGWFRLSSTASRLNPHSTQAESSQRAIPTGTQLHPEVTEGGHEHESRRRREASHPVNSFYDYARLDSQTRQALAAGGITYWVGLVGQSPRDLMEFFKISPGAALQIAKCAPEFEKELGGQT